MQNQVEIGIHKFLRLRVILHVGRPFRTLSSEMTPFRSAIRREWRGLVFSIDSLAPDA